MTVLCSRRGLTYVAWSNVVVFENGQLLRMLLQARQVSDWIRQRRRKICAKYKPRKRQTSLRSEQQSDNGKVLLSFFLAGRVFSPALRPYMVGPMRSTDIQNLLEATREREREVYLPYMYNQHITYNKYN